MPLNLQEFNIGALATLGEGKLALAFAREVSRIHGDICDRPSDDRARKLKMVLEFKPARVEAQGLETADVEIAIRGDIPPYQTRPYELRADPRQGQFQFNADSPEHVDQHTVDFNQSPDDDES